LSAEQLKLRSNGIAFWRTSVLPIGRPDVKEQPARLSFLLPVNFRLKAQLQGAARLKCLLERSRFFDYVPEALQALLEHKRGAERKIMGTDVRPP